MSEVERSRSDIDAYCPRVDKAVLIVDGRCFCTARNGACEGCVFDVDHVHIQLIQTMSAILHEKFAKETLSVC
jgi:hypothetical protein